MGFLSSAYSAQVSPTVAISSRFGVNVYSYESDLSIGGEWWIGRRRGKREQSPLPSMEEQRVLENKRVALDQASLREEVVEERLDSPIPLTTDSMPSPSPSSGLGELTNLGGSAAGHGHGHTEVPSSVEERDGVLKARISGDWVSPPLSNVFSRREFKG
jgi:distribution and morphology protein 10